LQDARRRGRSRRAPILAGILAAALAAGGTLLAPEGAAAWGPWLPAPGDVTLRTRFLAHSTRESYCPFTVGGGPETTCAHGARARYPSEGEAEERMLTLDAEIGVGDRVALDVRLAHYDLRFDDAFFLRETSGLGDVTVQARFAAARGRVPLAPYLAVKIPVGREMIAPDAIPVGEHQTDVEVGLHAGLSLWPRPAFLQARAAYRVRATNQETGRDPGDEAHVGADAGVWAGPLLLKAGVERMSSERLRLEGGAEEPARSVTRFSAAAILRVSPRVEIEGGVFLPVAGRNYPAGATYAIGAAARFSPRRGSALKVSETSPPRRGASSTASRFPAR